MLTRSERDMTFSIAVMYEGNGFLFRLVSLLMRQWMIMMIHSNSN
jgi:hypothetical protein